jgi:RNA polymerase sigma-70 factor (ECF subfamily)
MAIAAPSIEIHLTPNDHTTIEVHVSRMIGSYGFTEQDREDLQQDCLVDLLERLARFDPARAKRSTFVRRCVEHRLSDLIRGRQQPRRDYRRTTRGGEDDAATLLDEGGLCTCGAHRAEDPGSITAADLRMDVATVVESLPPRQRQVCDLLPALSPFAISRYLGWSKREVYAHVAAIRAAFRAAGLEPI